MSLPHRNRPLYGQTPHHNPAIRIACQQSTVGSYKLGCVNLSPMAAEDVRWLGWWQLHRVGLGSSKWLNVDLDAAL
jgi:hypothetical protein